MNKKILLGLFVVSSFSVVTPLFAAHHDTPKTPNIVEAAVATPALSTLVTAVTAGELVETLQGAGPFTVFAPTNDAFAKVDAKTLESLLKPENKSTLQKVLTYHVVSGKYTTKELRRGTVLTTVQGESLKVSRKVVRNDKNRLSVMITLTDSQGNKSNLTLRNINVSNGVVHVIDSVLMPK